MGKLNLNRFHLLCCSLWLLVLVFNGQMIFPAFYSLLPEQKCLDPESTSNATMEQCRLSVQQTCETMKFCKDVEVKEPAFGSMITEFDLLCDRSYYVTMISTGQFVGVFVGAIVYGHLADYYGRKPVSLAGIVTGLMGATANGYATSLPFFAICRFIVGSSMACLFVVFYTYMLELILPEQRVFMRMIFGSGLARLFFTFLCWLCGNWRTATVATAAVLLPVLLVVLILPEAPLWYRTKSRHGEAAGAQRHINWLAGSRLPKAEGEVVEEIEPRDEKVYTVKDLFSEGKMAKKTVVIASLWFCTSLAAYSSDLNSGSLGSFYLTHFAAGAATFVVKVLIFLIDTYCPSFSRRHLHRLPQSIVILSYLALTLIMLLYPRDRCETHSWQHWTVIALNIVGIAFKDIVWDACYLIAPEVFPTELRAVGVGLCSSVARIGAILAPQLVYLSQYSQAAPYGAIVGVSLLALVISVCFLPETKGVQLGETSNNAAKTTVPEREP